MRKIILITSDVISMQLSFFVAYFIRHGLSFEYINLYIGLVFVNILIQICVSFAKSPFDNFIERGYFIEFKQSVLYVSNVIMITFIYIFAVQTSYSFSRITFALYWIISIIFIDASRSILKALARQQLNTGEHQSNLIIIGKSASIHKAIKKINSLTYKKRNIIGFISTDTDEAQIENVLMIKDIQSFAKTHPINSAMFFDLDDPEVLKARSSCKMMGVTVHDVIFEKTNEFEEYGKIEELSGYTVATMSNKLSSGNLVIIKRIIDIIFGIIGVSVCSILAIIIGPMIYFSDRGPIFFSQIRVGKNGKKFKFYKFRSMYIDAESRKKDLIRDNEMDDFMFKIKDDPRIIKGIGNFIRKTSLDEFPQFFNVLKGDMSVVGTRPPTVDEYEKYSIHHMSRLSIKPGITGMWQVYGRNNIANFEDVVKLDNQYIENWSLGLDIKIIIKTVFSIVLKQGE